MSATQAIAQRSVELVPAADDGNGNGDTALAIQRGRLPALVEAGDVDELAAIAHTADLLRLHEQATKHAEAANAAARLKVEAEAAIGVIDIRLNPPQQALGPLVIGGKAVPRDWRFVLRLLGYGALQNLLNEALDVRASSPGRGGGPPEITTSGVKNHLRQVGAGRWAADPIKQAFEREKAARGLTAAELGRRVGRDPSVIYSLLHSRGPNRAVRTMSFEIGLALGQALGVEDQLRPAQFKHGLHFLPAEERRRRIRAAGVRAQHARRWRERDEAVRARGGKVAAVYSLVRKAEQMCTGARESLENRDARAELDSAVIDLLEAAARLHQAALLG